MTDFERFQESWEQAVFGMIGSVNGSADQVLTREEVDRLWRRELLENRFSTVKVQGEARAFLDELYARRPDVAGQVREMLLSSRMELGLNVGGTVAAAAGALGGGLLAALTSGRKDRPNAGRALFTIAAAALAAKTAKDVYASSKAELIKAIRAEADRQLEKYHAVLENID